VATEAFKSCSRFAFRSLRRAALLFPRVPAERRERKESREQRSLQRQRRIVENAQGIVNKFYSEVCWSTTVCQELNIHTDVLKACEKATGDTITITRFVRFQLGAA
jgi:translation elongation factor EF-Ts